MTPNISQVESEYCHPIAFHEALQIHRMVGDEEHKQVDVFLEPEAIHAYFWKLLSITSNSQLKANLKQKHNFFGFLSKW